LRVSSFCAQSKRQVSEMGSLAPLANRSVFVRFRPTGRHGLGVCTRPLSAIKTGSRCSFDHLVGATQNRRRNLKAERFGGLEIDNHFHFCRLLYW